jgi:uncharacterized membrane protein/protein-disulfide isomerase
MSSVLADRPTVSVKRALAVVVILSLIAAGFSGYMWVLSARLHAQGLVGPLPGCPDTDLVSCGEVLASRYSRWLGVPLAAAGVLNYVLLAVAGVGAVLTRSSPTRRALWAVGLALAGLGTLCGVWLLIVQIAFVHRFCLLCDVTHACGLASLVLLAVWRPANVPGGLWAGAGGVALAGTAVLVLGQLLLKPEVVATSIVVPPTATQAHGGADTRPAADTQAAAPVPGLRPVNYFDVADSAGTVIATLDLDDEIILGDPNARQTVVQFMDFGCPECGQEFELLQQVWKKHPHWFRLVVLIFPGNKECNAYTARLRPNVCEIARAALAVRKHSPEHYPEAHALFFKLRATPLTGGMAWQLVKQMTGIDDATLQAWQDDPRWLDKIKGHCETLHKICTAEQITRVLSLPVLLANGKMIDGAAASVGELEKYLVQLIGPAEAAAPTSPDAAPSATTVPASQPAAGSASAPSAAP